MKFKITVEVEFSEKGLRDYREAVNINYGDPTKALTLSLAKQSLREGLQNYALQGIEQHFSVMEIDPVDGHYIHRQP
jgi:hypothetical protein